jgi:hypothetical protein
MVEAISKVVPAQTVPKAQPVIPEKAQEKPVIPAPKRDVVTISDKGKEAVQVATAGPAPTEERKEPLIKKAVEMNVGKK